MRKSPMRRRLLARKPLRRRPLIRRKTARQNTHNFKRTAYVPAFVSTSAVSDVSFKLESTLADVPNFSEFTGLFDRYKIGGVLFKLIPRFNVAPVGPTTPSQIMTCLDYDGNGPTTIAAINQYQNLKVSRGTAIHKRFYKPAVLLAAYQSLTGTGYVPKWNQYLDTANAAVPHYGLYGMIPACVADVTYDLEVTYYIQCKNVR